MGVCFAPEVFIKIERGLKCSKVFSKQTPEIIIQFMPSIGYFYILTNTHHTVLYCGATDDLYRRIQEHKNKTFANSFTARFNLEKLVYFESFNSIGDAFIREKQVKGGSRKKKVELIEKANPEWKDLLNTISSSSAEELIRIKKFFK